MSTRKQTEIVRSGQQSEDPMCRHCAGITAHETWCITCNAVVYYAFRVVSDDEYLTPGDAIMLHALGVEWGGAACDGR